MTDRSRRDRMTIPPQAMPERDAAERRDSFDEVALGFGEDAAILEAQRCLLCRRPPCVAGCPVGVQITDFIALLAAGDVAGAADAVQRDNSLPAICGRVCPQEVQCEGECVLARKGKAIAIGALERYVADWQRLHGATTVAQPPPEPSGRRVAVVGSGPAGLACATDLVRLGHRVTVFEALHRLGGVLAYGIPEFRLPRDVVSVEIDQLRRLGVEFATDVVIGRAESVDELLGDDGFDAVFVGTGAGLPRFLDIPGENLVGVYSANEFLTRVNLMGAHLPDAATPLCPVAGMRVAVFGGGNTAMDAVRVAVRLGAAEALLVYRRTEEEMPARLEERRHAVEEGVVLRLLTAPVGLLGDDCGRLTGMRLQRLELGEPDADGRRRPVPVPGSEWEEPVDVAVVAVGNDPNPLLLAATPDLVTTGRGTLAADPVSGATSKPGVFAGGDIVTGGATVIQAMGAGRRAAAAIDAYLRQEQPATTVA